MKRIFYLGVALSTFLLGYLLAWLFFAHMSPDLLKATMSALEPAIRSERKSRLDGMRPTIRGCGNGYVQGYELTDGTKMGEGNDCHRSFMEASKAMTSRLQKSDKILDRTAPLEQKGRPKSDRVVAWFPADEYRNKSVMIMWVHGTCIHWIAAPDLELALEFEKSESNPYRFDE